MARLQASSLLILGLVPLACRHPTIHSPDNTPDATAVADSAARSAVLFTQKFYEWYARHDDRLEAAISDRPDAFSPDLLAALTADIDAQAKSPGEIVGLDWDPFTASQDPCDPYTATGAVRHADTIAVYVRPGCNDAAPDSIPATIAQVWHGPTGWVFVNFEYPADTSTLRDDLARLRRERERRENGQQR